MYDENFLGCKFEAISVRFSFSVVINLSTLSWNQLESHDFKIPLQSIGNQALRLHENQALLITIYFRSCGSAFERKQLVQFLHTTECTEVFKSKTKSIRPT